MLRVLKEVFGVVEFDNFSSLHHGDAIAKKSCHPEVVGNEQIGEVELRFQLEHELQHLGLHGCVQHADGLVANEELRSGNEGAGDRDALLLPSGKLGRVAIEKRFGRCETYPFEHIFDLAIGFGGRGEPVDCQGIGNAATDGHQGIETGVGILKNHLELAAIGPHLAGHQGNEIVAQKFHAAARRFDQLQNRARKGTLAATGLAHQTQNFAGVEFEADIVHGSDNRVAAAKQTRKEVGFESIVRLQILKAKQRCGRALLLRGNRRPGSLRSRLAAVERAGRIEERSRVGVPGLLQHLRCGTDFDELTLVHDGNAIAIGADGGEIVRNQKQRHLFFAAEAGEFVENLGGNGYVEAGGGLVGNDKFGIEQQGEGDRNALAHATTEFVGVLAPTAGRNVNGFEGGDRFRFRLLARQVGLVGEQRFQAVLSDPHQWIEPGGRILKKPTKRPRRETSAARRQKSRAPTGLQKERSLRRCCRRATDAWQRARGWIYRYRTRRPNPSDRPARAKPKHYLQTKRGRRDRSGKQRAGDRSRAGKPLHSSVNGYDRA